MHKNLLTISLTCPIAKTAVTSETETAVIVFRSSYITVEVTPGSDNVFNIRHHCVSSSNRSQIHPWLSLSNLIAERTQRRNDRVAFQHAEKK